MIELSFTELTRIAGSAMILVIFGAWASSWSGAEEKQALRGRVVCRLCLAVFESSSRDTEHCPDCGADQSAGSDATWMRLTWARGNIAEPPSGEPIMMNERRVVITGVGCVSPLGNDAESTWSGMKEGRSGIARITHLDPYLASNRGTK